MNECRICNSKDLTNFKKLDRQKEIMAFQKCNNCKVIQQKKIYEMDYKNDYRLSEPFVMSPQNLFKREYNRLPSILDYMKRKGKMNKDQIIVELGCGHGGMTKALQDRGYNAIGFDLGKRTIKIGQKNGSNVYVGSTKEIQKLKVKVGTIFSSHLFEHLHNPVMEMLNLKECLTPKGIMVIETPNIDINPKNQYQKPHPYYFNEESLKNCLKQAGYKTKYLNKILFGIFIKELIE